MINDIIENNSLRKDNITYIKRLYSEVFVCVCELGDLDVGYGIFEFSFPYLQILNVPASLQAVKKPIKS